MNRFASVCAAAALALLSACAAATTQPGRESLYLSSRPAPRENCRPAPVPSRLPALSELADSAALVAAIGRFAEQHRFSA
ncbi:MAG TPA: hypothetical protein VFQ76_13915, partial [Longimicrobiaceae bacterium]|nr:hypothetical protein [Longimicrobiaceae bacterium]